MFYGQWGEQCSLQRKREYFLDDDGKDKKAPDGVSSGGSDTWDKTIGSRKRLRK